MAKLTTSGAWLSAVRAGGSLDDNGYGVGSDITGNLYATGSYSSASAAFGSIGLSNPGSPGYTTSFLARSLADLVVNTGSQMSTGVYNNVTITSTGSTTLSSFLVANGVLTVQSGGTLNSNCQPITGAGSFVLAAGGTLGICHAQGIASTGPAAQCK
ncbi:hypothetical protein [Hymenobacter sp. BRD67]|uniref:hypothetical protein n=1 Tax=Hymenobacter sp. BRD67 TaxID=2675877 RepID=UPI0015660E7D|nr:hypothetical protein [Hymenobacter sp. BRD67]QKG54351.1 hypothetical protein GKZ67_19280 [Hymenobacter sp. BRD67]